MRPILNFMLRLFIDEQSPPRIHGAIKPAGEGNSFAFKSEEELMDFLHKVSDSARLQNGDKPRTENNPEV